jgi:hypothetical protein
MEGWGEEKKERKHAYVCDREREEIDKKRKRKE